MQGMLIMAVFRFLSPTVFAFKLLGLCLLVVLSGGQVLGADRSNWTGTWETRWRGGGAILRLLQTDGQVNGSYALYDGEVEGTVQGRQLQGRWSEASGRSGAFLFTLARDGRSFMGRFDNGEWWTGTRLSGSHEHAITSPNLSSPREALRTFLEAANAARAGSIDQIRPALDAIDYSDPRLRSSKVEGGPLLPGEMIAYARQLFLVIDELTLRLWDLPGAPVHPSMGSETVRVTLAQNGTDQSFELEFILRDGRWMMVPPAPADLDAALTRLRERWGGRPASAHDHLRLSNPRDTLRTFMEAMGRVDKGGATNVLRTLDLAHYDVHVRDDDALLMAYYLEQILRRVGVPIYQEIPNDPLRSEAYTYFRHGEGDIVIASVPSGNESFEWRFSVETLHRLRHLYAAMEDMPVVPGAREITHASTYFAVRDGLRSRLPGLLHRLGPAEGWQWLSLLLLLMISYGVAAAITFGILWSLRRRSSWAAAFSTQRARRRLVWPLRLTLIGLSLYFGLQVLGLPELLSGPLRNLAATLSIIVGVWLTYRGLGLAADYSGLVVGTTGNQAILTSLTFGLLRITVVVAGILLVAQVWSLPYASVLAGLGIGGLAVALAAQPTLQNMIAGFTLFADSPLSVGDFCRYGDKLGTLEKIGLRSTRIRSLDRTVVTIPNSEFANLQLENFARRDRILLRTIIELRYETTPDQLRFVLAELRRLLLGHPRVHPDPARVRFLELGPHSLNVEVFAYVATFDWNDYLAIREDLFLRVMEIVRQSGTGFAFPTQVNYLARDPGNDPELTRQAEQTVAAWRSSSRLPFPDFPAAEIRQLDGKLDYPPLGSAGNPASTQPTHPAK
jgi:small-conductance mechanosensitive channel